MPLPDATQPPDFDPPPGEGLAHGRAEVGPVRHYEGILPGQRPYMWKCPRPDCGAENFGLVEHGCKACGVGKDGRAGQPEPARDVVCKACRGNKTVSVKCKQCKGTGEVDIRGGTDTCLDCGGTGQLTLDCRRCEGTGFDPEPMLLAVQEEDMAQLLYPDPPRGMGAIVSTPEPQRSATPEPQRSALPSLDDIAPPGRARYLLTEICEDGSATSCEIEGGATVRGIIAAAKRKPFPGGQ